jgi:hypothetical protein
VAYFEVINWQFSSEGSDKKPPDITALSNGVLRLTGYGPPLWAIKIHRSPAVYESEASPLLSKL